MTRALEICVSALGGRREQGLARLFERRDGGSGRKARRRVGSLIPGKANPRNGETPRASREGFFTVKAAGRGDARHSTLCGESTRGAEAHEGRGSVETQPVSTDTALAAGSKALKSRRSRWSQAVRSNARGHDAAGETRYGSRVRDIP